MMHKMTQAKFLLYFCQYNRP